MTQTLIRHLLFAEHVRRAHAGSYHFTNADTVVCTNAAGVTVTYKRIAKLATATPDDPAPDATPVNNALPTFQTVPNSAPTKR